MMRVWILGVVVGVLLPGAADGASEKPNLLIITVDDMSCDSVGVYGCSVPGTTPSIDDFAATALRFNRAHVVVGNCMPGRNLMWSGLYSHANGVEGFRQNKRPDFPVLCDLAKSAGYFTGIRGKVSHSTPHVPYQWDAVLDTAADGSKHELKNPSSYGASTAQGIALAAQAGKPFCLMINISDPHKPFYGIGRQNKPFDDPFVPSRVFDAGEVAIPGFLFDDSVVREELALYYSSVRRADDALASILAALESSGQSDDTFVMFLSDHGMPLPFAKTQLYHHSTHTPLIVRWPGVTKAGKTDDSHFVSAIDFLPTLIEVMATEHPSPGRLHGESFAGLLYGRSEPQRTAVVKQYNENSGRGRHPMRGIQTERFLYLYNPWSDGQRIFKTATTGTAAYRRMKQLAGSDPEMAARKRLFDHRVVEELYDVQVDPDCLTNLIAADGYRDQAAELRKRLAAELGRVGDPVADLLVSDDEPRMRRRFMVQEDSFSESLRTKKRKSKK